MLKEILTKENLYTFLANSQNVTTRAVRLAEEQNPEKFEREAMGALMKASGFTLESLYSCLVQYPKIFDFEENIKKLKVLDSLSNVLGSKYSYIDITDYNDYKALSGFMKKYFENYTNEYDGRLNFYVKEQIELGTKAATVLVCESIDLISSVDAPSKTHYIPLILPGLNTLFTLDSIIENVKNTFKEYKENENSKITHKIKQVLHTVDNREYGKNSIMGIMKDEIGLKNEVFLDYIELSYEDKLIIRPTEHYENIEHSFCYYKINGLEYFKDYNCSRSEEQDSLFQYFYKVAESMNLLENIVISTNISKINELRLKIEKLEEEEKDEYMFEYLDYISNIIYIIFENISKGLSSSISNAEKNIEIYRPAWNTIKKSTLKKKWELIEEHLYTRETQI